MGSTERAKNTASSKDLCKVFRGYSLALDASKWRDDTEVLVERHEVLLQDIFAETPRLLYRSGASASVGFSVLCVSKYC